MVERRIKKLIEQKGYLELEVAMSIINSDSKDSYYQNIQNIGERGDFITAPEISQIFGEIIGLWVIEKWQELGAPKAFCLLELGGGRGVLMRDLLRACSLYPSILDAMKLCFYEVNPHFIELQQKIASLAKQKPRHIKNLDELDGLPLIVVANEFFDALPIRQYKKIGSEWRELVIISKDGGLGFDYKELAAEKKQELLEVHPRAFRGAVVEESRESIEIATQIAWHLKQYSGKALIIDYGYSIPPSSRGAGQYKSTLQAIKLHKYHDLLTNLGSADWSAHVDFEPLARAFDAANISSQRDFLFKYGAKERCAMLKEKNPECAEVLDAQVKRLTDKDGMGELFKVLEC